MWYSWCYFSGINTETNDRICLMGGRTLDGDHSECEEDELKEKGEKGEKKAYMNDGMKQHFGKMIEEDRLAVNSFTRNQGKNLKSDMRRLSKHGVMFDTLQGYHMLDMDEEFPEGLKEETPMSFGR